VAIFLFITVVCFVFLGACFSNFFRFCAELVLNRCGKLLINLMGSVPGYAAYFFVWDFGFEEKFEEI